ncbi:MAG TPA: macro domain-containing protein [Streptosporangiaceae bacterium]|jgi:O-acetyl-ADP-ribose deacetylase (regulator of RNase III)
MLREAEGNLLEEPADALVNTVNTVGVMGKGIALQFKQAFPQNFRAYEAACRRREVQIGRMFVVETGLLELPRLIINFPTKRHWRSHSRLDDIRSGLADLRQVLVDRHVRSVALPPLGCGNGGLDWRDVRPLIEGALGDLVEVEVVVYPPKGAPPPDSMRVRTSRPPVTPGRAALLTLLARYVGLSRLEEPAAPDGTSLLEIQKLMYFLQEAGQQLRLSFVKGRYGPYAENLNPVLQTLEGHYLRGYGDRTQEVMKLSPISLLPGAADAGREWLDAHPDETVDRIDAVLALVTGFASAYGLELLATVHWVLMRDGADAGNVVRNVSAWSDRKGRLFTQVHIERAAERLRVQNWIAAPAR